MAWLAKNINGDEYIFDSHPYQHAGRWFNIRALSGNTIKLPIGTIEKIIGKKLSLEDGPVELK